MKQTNLKTIEEEYKNGMMRTREYMSKIYKERHDVLFEYAEYIKDRDIQKIEITDGCVMMTTRDLGIRMLCNRYDEGVVLFDILNFGAYEKQDSEMIFKLVKDNDVVFDIGGNLGYYTIALDKAKNHLDIHTFEPIPSTYETLLGNIRLNGTNAKINNFGLSDKKDEISFYFYKECSGNASAAKMNEDRDNIEIKCKIDTLDNYCIDNQIKRLDFIKCDVEGAELFTYRGGS